MSFKRTLAEHEDGESNSKKYDVKKQDRYLVHHMPITKSEFRFFDETITSAFLCLF